CGENGGGFAEMRGKLRRTDRKPGRFRFDGLGKIPRHQARLVLAEPNGISLSPDRIGTARRIDDAVGRYIEFVKASFPKRMRLDGLKIVCDCANGAAYKVGPYTLRELGADVIPICDRPDGHNINLNCGSEHPEEMRATVIRERADLGISFDGDGDRLIMADEDGRMLDGNAILAILGIDLLERDALPGKTVVANIVANAGLERALQQYGGAVLRTQVGDRFIVEAMRERGLILGGESSGHIVMLEHNTTGDAIIAGLNVLATMLRKDQPMSVLASAYQPLPEAHAKVPLNGRPVPTPDQLDAVVHEVDTEINGAGMAIVRPSGTEPVIRVMVQHEALRKAEAIARRLAERINDIIAH
ncbi:MAG: phosphoglucosamine mutase, partial [Candidatus Hydrogenedentes bacterium]|nr:phosphoglucosamine mutase [Candidatus Hydrogenedentota bacterium]